MNEDIYEAVRVTPPEIQGVYGLIMLSHPDVTLGDWKQFARPLVKAPRRDRGIVALRDGRGCTHGLFSFRVAQLLGCDTVLQVTELAALRLPGTVLLQALLRFADDLARELGLPSIALDMQRSATAQQDVGELERRGFSLDRVLLRGRASRRTGSCSGA